MWGDKWRRHETSGSLQLLHDELSSTCAWVSVHVSDHSGFHYRQFLLQQLATELSQAPPPAASSGPAHPEANGELAGAEEAPLASTTLLQLVHQELELCADLIRSFPGHETLWSHR